MTHLARDWPALIEKNTGILDAERIALFRQAATSQITGATAAVIRASSWRIKDNHTIDEIQKALLLEIAARAKPDEAVYLLQLVEWSGEANLQWAFKILKALPIREVAPQMLEQVLQALVPYGERKIDLPRDVLGHVLMQLVPVPDLDLFHHSREWES